MSLRERKKVKTRISIQKCAMRLFLKQGYNETTIEQIAATAEVSPSTFFRYFPTKEDLVMYDPLDPLIMESFRLQPAELGPIQALRATMQAVFGSLSDDELTEISQKGKLMTTVPELRSKALDELVRSFDVFARMVAERIGKPSEDLTVRVVVGAIMGVMMSVLFTVPQDHPMNLFTSMDAALGQMEKLLAL
jgi:AcrR family transcriptional regulator